MPKTLTINDVLVDTVCNLIRNGETPSQAFKACGVSPSTRTRWIRRGRGLEEPPSPECEELVRQIDEAWHEGIQNNIANYHTYQVQLERTHERDRREKMRQLELENVRLRADLAALESFELTVERPPSVSRKTIRVISRRSSGHW